MDTIIEQANPVPIKPDLLEELLLLRRRKGWTQERLAEKLGVSAGSVRSWEQRARNPSRSQQVLIRAFIENEIAPKARRAAARK